MERYERKLDQVERRLPNVLAVSFADLADEDVCAAVFEHCLQLPHDHDWWGQVAALNLQVDLPRIVAYIEAHAAQLTKLAKVAAHRCIAGMRQPEREFDGVTFQVEPFRQAYDDAQAMIAEHMVRTGQSPDDAQRKNVALYQRLDDLGYLQTMTARCNGRLFGYLVTIIAPSLEDYEQTIATHTAFVASAAIPRLGMRMLRAANDALRERGVNEAQMRAGVRGDGPRLGVLYRRLGAEPFGELYRLELGEV
jgi:L-amino acid N-acyltransferase YncA